eukprot:g21717.t1
MFDLWPLVFIGMCWFGFPPRGLRVMEEEQSCPSHPTLSRAPVSNLHEQLFDTSHAAGMHEPHNAKLDTQHTQAKITLSHLRGGEDQQQHPSTTPDQKTKDNDYDQRLQHQQGHSIGTTRGGYEQDIVRLRLVDDPDGEWTVVSNSVLSPIDREQTQNWSGLGPLGIPLPASLGFGS